MTAVLPENGPLVGADGQPTRQGKQYFEELAKPSPQIAEALETIEAQAETIAALQEQFTTLEQSVNGLFLPRYQLVTDLPTGSNIDVDHQLNTTDVFPVLRQYAGILNTVDIVSASRVNVRFTTSVSGLSVLLIAPPEGEVWPT